MVGGDLGGQWWRGDRVRTAPTRTAHLKLTKPQRRAMIILRDFGPMRPGWFSTKMWPDSPSHRNRSRCGQHGARVATGIHQKAGQFLSSLRRLGLVQDGHWPNPHRISAKGRQALKIGMFTEEKDEG
jgi:hypothetical protein